MTHPDDSVTDTDADIAR